MVGAVLAVLAIGALLVWSTAERDTNTPAAASHSGNPDSEIPLPAEQSADDQQPSQTAKPSTLLWRVVDEDTAPAKPPYPAEWSDKGRALVDVSRAARTATGWQVGERVSMLLPQLGVSYEGDIELIAEGPGYSRSARGWAQDRDGQARRFVVTVGPTRVFAYIDTAEGPYELAADTRLGWLLPTSSMLAGIDFSKPDYIIPEPPAEPDDPVQ